MIPFRESTFNYTTWFSSGLHSLKTFVDDVTTHQLEAIRYVNIDIKDLEIRTVAPLLSRMKRLRYLGIGLRGRVVQGGHELFDDGVWELRKGDWVDSLKSLECLEKIEWAFEEASGMVEDELVRWVEALERAMAGEEVVEPPVAVDEGVDMVEAVIGARENASGELEDGIEASCRMGGGVGNVVDSCEFSASSTASFTSGGKQICLVWLMGQSLMNSLSLWIDKNSLRRTPVCLLLSSLVGVLEVVWI